MTRLSFIVALLVACGTQPTVDPRVAEHVAAFYTACADYGADCADATVLVVSDGVIDGTGDCTSDGTIRINEREIESQFIWAAVWHELGHCALDLRHTEIECPTLMLASISKTVLDSGTCTQKEYSELLLRELVTADWCDAAVRCGLL